jgi:UDP-N-acetylmuramoyl-tripeptide--D-alanyl-D-alanine ligase
MEPRSLQYVVSAVEGELRGPASGQVTRVCTDSRTLQPGDLFIAIRGPSFDGHDFALEAAAKGAVAVLVEQGSPAPTDGCTVVTVDDTRLALGRLAATYRRDFQLPVIGVAGSNGKTSTKDLLASVLNQNSAHSQARAALTTTSGATYLVQSRWRPPGGSG